jgi:transcriptional regulator with XRE-family HTH domain
VPSPPSDLDRKLSKFLKRSRGEMSFAQFSKITGLTPSTLFRLEQCDQTITLRRLEPVLKRLKVTIVEVFGETTK